MRIVHADTDDLDNPLRGGQPVRTYHVNRQLAAEHDITVLTATYPGCLRRMQRDGISYRRLGVTVPGFGLSPHLSYLASLGPALRRIPHDLVVEEFTPPVGFAMLPWWTAKPVVCIVQWFAFDAWQQRYRLPFERMMRAAARRGGYRNFIVQSEAMRAYFAALLPEARIWVVGCGADEDIFQPPGRDGDYALFLGRLDIWQKGLDLLMQAWALNHRRGASIPLRIVGEGPGREFLEREIAAAGMGDFVTLLGRLEGPAKRAVLHDAACVVMPSRQETFGIVAAEGMAASKPVVGFDIDHLNELLRPEWSVLVGRPEAAALADAVLALWYDQPWRRILGERAFAAAQAHRWPAIARQHRAIYQDVVGSCHRR